MFKKISKRFIFKTLFLLLLIPTYMVISGEQGINAMPGGCEIKSIEINVSPAPTESDTEDFRIMCGGAGQIKWNGIKSSANLTNQTSKVNNYDKYTGRSGALNDFYKMPGKTQNLPDGVLTRQYDGKTVTYYPRATSTGKPTLQYPASNSRVWDKIRYK
ncbi:hypothetical protein ACFFJI_12815 [Allobacillus sp. GCM10007491]|uniref:Uncharacterized protein n=1 Tax=Allobacillus saliphilus TaxID=2912308 RepID=A0A941CV39_9BACI|nr:hypothetical protein [Allobacillus saliphilus]MBR7554397.1 hypothetical protein [Allobacillus saliphilus]